MKTTGRRSFDSPYDVQEEIDKEIKKLEYELSNISDNGKKKNKRLIIISLIERLTEELK